MIGGLRQNPPCDSHAGAVCARHIRQMDEARTVMTQPLNRSRIAAAALAARRALAAGLGATVATLAVAGGAGAETRQALVIALRGAGQEVGTSAADALAVSQAALAAGFDVRRLEYPTTLPAAPATPADVMLVYLSGSPRTVGGDAVFDLPSGPIGLGDLAARFGGAGRLILLAETCPAAAMPDDAATADLDAPRPAGAALVALSPAPGKTCGPLRLTAALTQALTTPGAEIAARLGGAGAAVETGPGWVDFTATPARDEPAATLIVAAPIRPLGADSVTAPIRARQAIAGGAAGDGGVSIFAAAAPPPTAFPSDRAARPAAQGLPQPSVIVGDQPAPDAPQPGASLSGTTIGSGFEDRERMRQDDPALFAELLASGAFDPDAAQIASAIQTELARMECYRGQVDGVWGNGSRGAVDRYFDEIDASAPSREADVTLFRALAQRPDVTCPAPAPTPVAAPATPRQPAASTSTRRSTPAAAPAPSRSAPAPQQPTERRINPGALGTGVFR